MLYYIGKYSKEYSNISTLTLKHTLRYYTLLITYSKKSAHDTLRIYIVKILEDTQTYSKDRFAGRSNPKRLEPRMGSILAFSGNCVFLLYTFQQ